MPLASFFINSSHGTFMFDISIIGNYLIKGLYYILSVVTPM
jgi:hypothetical protein